MTWAVVNIKSTFRRRATLVVLVVPITLIAVCYYVLKAAGETAMELLFDDVPSGVREAWKGNQRTETLRRSEPNHYRGWDLYRDANGPVTGLWRAMRNGVGMGHSTREGLLKMIDAKRMEELENDRKR